MLPQYCAYNLDSINFRAILSGLWDTEKLFQMLTLKVKQGGLSGF